MAADPDVARVMRVMARTMLLLTPPAFLATLGAALAQGGGLGQSLFIAIASALCCLFGALLFHVRGAKSAGDFTRLTAILQLFIRS
jgi:hypothetical protein